MSIPQYAHELQDGDTPLHEVAKTGSVAVAEVLMGGSPDIELTNEVPVTAVGAYLTGMVLCRKAGRRFNWLHTMVIKVSGWLRVHIRESILRCGGCDHGTAWRGSS